MIWLYRLLFLPALLLVLPYYFMRMRRRGGYRADFSHRFGATPPLSKKRTGVKRVWLQAVSVGEMLAIAPLLERLRLDPEVEVYLTTTTSTGYALAHERYAGLVVGIGYFPVDWWLFSRRTWNAVTPDMAIVTEGERWPEHIHQARIRGVPIIAVNARLSNRSFRRMLKFRGLTGPLLQGISRVLAGSVMDAERFKKLGFPADRITTTGNIKLDVTIPLISDLEKTVLRQELGFGEEPVLLGSSTWPGEETALIAAYRALRAEGHTARLLIVPRHAERRAEVEMLLKASGLSYHFRSHGAATSPVEVAVGDTTGELRQLAQLATVVFVGKSLPPHHEGQTPVEAAVLGKPVVFGPSLTNFKAIARELVRGGAARSVTDARALTVAVMELWSDRTMREKMAGAAQAWHLANQGAVERTLAVLRSELAG